MNAIRAVVRGLWELAHTLDGVWVSWPPLRLHVHPVRWEDRRP